MLLQNRGCKLRRDESARLLTEATNAAETEGWQAGRLIRAQRLAKRAKELDPTNVVAEAISVSLDHWLQAKQIPLSLLRSFAATEACCLSNCLPLVPLKHAVSI